MGACISVHVGGKPALRLGDRLYERRAKCVEEFGLRLVASINDQLRNKATRKKLKEAYHYGIYKLNEANATPTTKLFLEKSTIKHIQDLEEETMTDVKPQTTDVKPKKISLRQYTDLEDIVTKPILQQHGLGVHLELIPNSHRYGVWLSWFNAPPKAPLSAASVAHEEQPRFKLPFDGMLPSTVHIGQLDIHRPEGVTCDALPISGSFRY